MRRVVLALLCALAAHAAGDDFMNCDFSSGTPVWAVRVRAVDSKWNLVDGLHAGDFALTAHHMATSLCGFTMVRRPVSGGIVLDASGSMRASIRRLWPGVEQIVRSSGPQEEYFLIAVNDAVTMAVGFTRETSSIRAAFTANAKGGTKLFDGIYAALLQMKAARNQTRALIVFSDGIDNESSRDEEDLKKALSDSSLPVFWIVPPDELASQSAKKAAASKRALADFVAVSGGYILRMDELKEFLTVASGLADAIRAPYELLFQGPQWQTRPEVQVRVNGVSPRPRLFTEMASQAQR